MDWYWILTIILSGTTFFIILSIFLYAPFFKRVYDIIFSLIGIGFFLPFFLILILVGLICFRGNPFFIQKRPGKDEKIFTLIKFKSMNNKKDKYGNLLEDEKRLTKYGLFLRATSLDELPELFNIFLGQMSFIGPRPLLVKYLDRYNSSQHHRHDVRPGLTGLAQCHGRNKLSWDRKFELDLWYIKHISFMLDAKIIFKTIKLVFNREGINAKNSSTTNEFQGN